MNSRIRKGWRGPVEEENSVITQREASEGGEIDGGKKTWPSIDVYVCSMGLPMTGLSVVP